MTTRWGILCGLGLLVLGYFLLPTAALLLPKTSRFPDTWVSKALVHRFDEKGQLEQQLSMDSWIHYSDNTIRMENLDLKIYHQTLLLWHAGAEEGSGYQSGQDISWTNQLTLKKSVTMTRFLPTQAQVWRLNTDELQLTPDEAYTDALALLTGPGQTFIQSTGARVNLHTGDIQLLSEVKSHYDISTL